MTPFPYAHAAADDWARIARDLADGLGAVPAGGNGAGRRLGFLYVTDVMAGELGSIHGYLRQTTGVEDWVGTVGIGICAGASEYFNRPAAAALVAEFPEDGHCILTTIAEGTQEIPSATHDWIEATAPPFGIVHGDPANGMIEGIVQSLGLEAAGFLVGGLSSSRRAQPQIAGEITSGGVSGVLFAPGVEVATGLSQGCLPVGPGHVVSDCLDNIVIGLDGEPALDVFKADVGELLARDLNRAAGYIHAAFPIEGSDTGDYLVRNLIGIDPARGWLAVGEEVQAGDRVMFVRRDPKSAEDDLTRMIEDLKGRLPAEPRGGLYFTCVARGPNMFGAEGREMAVIREHLGDFPLVGFYGNGEISNNRLYGYTGVLALFL